MKANFRPAAPLAATLAGPARRLRALRRRPALLGGAGAGLLLMLASCTAPVVPVASVGPPPAPRPTMVAAPPPLDWRDAPMTPGQWVWAATRGASFVDERGHTLLRLTCWRAPGMAPQVALAVNGSVAMPALMTITTSTLTRQVTAAPLSGGTTAGVMLPAHDPLLDAMAFTRGRMAVEVAGMATMTLPTAPEISRVVEDCRAAG